MPHSSWCMCRRRCLTLTHWGRLLRILYTHHRANVDYSQHHEGVNVDYNWHDSMGFSKISPPEKKSCSKSCPHSFHLIYFARPEWINKHHWCPVSITSSVCLADRRWATIWLDNVGKIRNGGRLMWGYLPWSQNIDMANCKLQEGYIHIGLGRKMPPY